MGNDSPYLTVHAVDKFYFMIVFVLRHQYDSAIHFAEAFDREFAVDHGNDDFFVYRFQGAVHNENISGENAGIDHGFAGCPDKKGGGRMLNQVFVQVKLAFNIIFRRGREPSCHRHHKQRACLFCRKVGAIYFLQPFVHSYPFSAVDNFLCKRIGLFFRCNS